MSETRKFDNFDDPENTQPLQRYDLGNYQEPIPTPARTPELADFQNVFLAIAGGNYDAGLGYDLTEGAHPQSAELSTEDIQAFLKRLYENHIEDDEHLAKYEEEIAAQYNLSPGAFLHILKGSFGLVTWKDIRGVGEERARMKWVHAGSSMNADTDDVNKFLIFFKIGEREFVELDSHYNNPKTTHFSFKAENYTPDHPESEDSRQGIHAEVHIRNWGKHFTDVDYNDSFASEFLAALQAIPEAREQRLAERRSRNSEDRQL